MASTSTGATDKLTVWLVDVPFDLTATENGARMRSKSNVWRTTRRDFGLGLVSPGSGPALLNTSDTTGSPRIVKSSIHRMPVFSIGAEGDVAVAG